MVRGLVGGGQQLICHGGEEISMLYNTNV